MALKVYISGDKVLLQKDLNPIVFIPQNLCFFKIINEDIDIFSTIDATVGESDILANIQDAGGTPIGNLQEVIKYLNVFILQGSSVGFPTGGGGGTGEANTGSNVGAGDGVFKQKTGVDLEFKTLIGGTNVTITNNANDLTINASGIGSTLRNVSSADAFATDNETVNCTNGTFTVTLPTAVGIQGTIFTLVNSGTGQITLDPNGTETINGSLTIVLRRQYISRTVQSDGTNWVVI
tara:strand:- start:2620 stop:3327 length:708 start_codon:yes stop_codon:yes gene_type:complete